MSPWFQIGEPLEIASFRSCFVASETSERPADTAATSDTTRSTRNFISGDSEKKPRK